MTGLLWETSLLDSEDVIQIFCLILLRSLPCRRGPLIFISFCCEKRVLGLGDCQFLNAKRCCLQLLREENHCLKGLHWLLLTGKVKLKMVY
jgi:hypothetical protein